MHEYFSEALVLDREPYRDLDDRFSLFTKRFGKLVAKAKSSRKITSKLSGHLQPGNIVYARFVERGGLQLVDALKIARLERNPNDLHSLHLLLSESEADPRLWNTLITRDFNWPELLKVLGWDPSEAVCALCGGMPARSFHIASQEFFCRPCSSKSVQNTLIYLDGAARTATQRTAE